MFCFFVFKQKTAYEMRISDWSSDVCSSDLPMLGGHRGALDEWQQVALNALARDVGAAALGARGDLVDLVQEDDAVLLDSGDRGADYRLLVEQLVALLGDQDRKSTRLNSSH